MGSGVICANSSAAQALGLIEGGAPRPDNLVKLLSALQSSLFFWCRQHLTGGEEGIRKQAAHLLEQCKWKGMGRRVLGSKQLICWSNVSRCVEGHGEEGIRKQAAHLLEQCKPLCGRAWGGGY